MIGLRSGSFFTRERYAEGDVPLCRFQYCVRLDRLSAAGNPVFVTVGEKDIETIEEDRDSIIRIKDQK